MKTIKVLVSGCSKCRQTTSVIRETLTKLGIEANVEKVEDIQEIMKYKVMTTPAVIIDEMVMLKGRVPSMREMELLLK
ncbi:MAG: small redox-active disulfide protein 2 [Nonlabens sp.]|jgi:small redox-active disulfide protein 2